MLSITVAMKYLKLGRCSFFCTFFVHIKGKFKWDLKKKVGRALFHCLWPKRRITMYNRGHPDLRCPFVSPCSRGVPTPHNQIPPVKGTDSVISQYTTLGHEMHFCETVVSTVNIITVIFLSYNIYH